jgi:hypothetical protein
MARVPSGGASPAGSVARPVAGIVLLALVLAWTMLTVLDLRADDGLVGAFVLFGIPALASAIVIQVAGERLVAKAEPRGYLWWVLGVLPVGIVAAFAVPVIRDPTYFIDDDGPWMLIWIPIFVACGVLLGAVVWFFVVWPLVLLARVSIGIARGEGGLGGLVMPLVLLAVPVIGVVGAMAIDADLYATRGFWFQALLALLGLPGSYEVIWEPGLWILRGLTLAVVLLLVLPGRVFTRSQREPEA